jgi:hypothetical protein
MKESDFVIIIVTILTILALLAQLYLNNSLKECFCTDYEKIKNENPSFNKVYRFNIPSFNRDIRKWFIREAEKHGKIHSWTTKRHDSYATTDIPVNDISSIKDYINKHVKKDIFTKFEQVSGIKADNFSIDDVFIVKYKQGDQVDLEKHQDGSTYTFTMLLNDPSEFEGGGTYFYNNQKLLKPTNNEVVIHCGLIYHEGAKITKGQRYLLIGFCYASDDCDG